MTGPGHIDPEELALDQAGAVERERSEQIAAHLAECPDCRARAEAIRAVSAALRVAPAAPMPSDVADRITAALAEERAATTAQQSQSAATQTVVPLSGKRGWFRGANVAALIAAAAAIALIAAIAVSHFSAGNSPGGATAENPTTITGNTGLMTAAERTALQRLTSSDPTDYSPGRIEAQLSREVYASEATPASSPRPMMAPRTNQSTKKTPSSSPSPAILGGSASFTISPLLRPFTNPSRVFNCVKDINNGVFVLPLAVKLARYDTKPAVVIVLPPGTLPSSTTAYAYVLDTTCGATDYDGTVKQVQAVPPPSPLLSSPTASPSE